MHYSGLMDLPEAAYSVSSSKCRGNADIRELVLEKHQLCLRGTLAY